MKKVAILFTKKGEPIIIDAVDYELVKDYTWYINQGYVHTDVKINGKFQGLLMHRLITNAQSGQLVDHKNRITNDNRHSNLRIATSSQNRINSSIRKDNSSGYIGVYFHKLTNKWAASININKKIVHLGTFTNLQDAITARQEAEVKYYGDFRPTR